MLAFISNGEFNILYNTDESLSSLTCNSITLLKELKKQLKKIRNQVYAIDKQEYKTEINCLAVPAKNKEGKKMLPLVLQSLHHVLN